jgi:hypothetical protein
VNQLTRIYLFHQNHACATGTNAQNSTTIFFKIIFSSTPSKFRQKRDYPDENNFLEKLKIFGKSLVRSPNNTHVATSCYPEIYPQKALN